MKRRIFAAALAVFFLALPDRDAIQANTSSSSYTVEDLGGIDGLVPTVTGMNASGQISGHVSSNIGPRAVRYTNRIGWEYLHAGPTYSLALGINASGDVTGYHFVASVVRAFRYTDGVGVTAIDPLPGGTFAVGFAINASGDVTGYGDSASGTRGWLAKLGGKLVMLPTLGGDYSMTCGINDASQIVGSSTTLSGQVHAYRVDVDGATMTMTTTDIVPFDGPAGSGSACAIDAAGRVGGATTSGAVNRAFRFDGTALVNLDTFASSQSNVTSIANGVSVGWFVEAVGGAYRAFVHSDQNGAVNLNDLIPPGSGWTLGQAHAVNTEGAIAGNGALNGSPRAFRLTPAAPADTTAPVISSVSATPSSVWPPNGALVPIEVSATATDSVDPAPVCALSSINASATTADDYSIDGPRSARVRAVGGRTYALTVTCSDAAGNSASASTSVVVPPDTTAPVIADVHATPDAIWPPNGKMVAVTVSVSATDDVDSAPQCLLTSISSNGGSANDAVKTGPFTANLRAQRNGDGSVRAYTLHVQCADVAGNKSHGAATVVVGKDWAALKAFLRAQGTKLVQQLQRSRGSSR